jgi:hypothetical protein
MQEKEIVLSFKSSMKTKKKNLASNYLDFVYFKSSFVYVPLNS